MDSGPEFTLEDVRAVAREEIASLAGLVLRRLQDVYADYAKDNPDATTSNTMLTTADVNEIWGEVLHDFGGTTEEPGVSEAVS